MLVYVNRVPTQTTIAMNEQEGYQQKCNVSHNHGKSFKYHPHRPKVAQVPIFWERPHFPSWDPNLHYHAPDSCHMDEYYRRQNDCYRYESDSILNISKGKRLPSVEGNGLCHEYCASHFYAKPAQTFCTCEKAASSLGLPICSKFNQVNPRTVSTYATFC